MTALVRPPALRSGDTIAIVPTARAITLDELQDGIALLESWGLRVKIGAGIGRKHFQFAGTDVERAADLQQAIDDPEVRAIWCARGGYGTVRLLDHLDLSKLKRDRKWNEDGARKQLVQFFDAWGPTDEATLSGRRKLSSLLFS